MPLSTEFQILLNNLYSEIDRMSIDELKQLGEYAVSKGIETSGTRMPLAEGIIAKSGEQKAGTYAKLGIEDINLREKQREFDINKNLTQQQIDQRTKEYEETKALNERALEASRKESARAARDWWKPFVGQVAGAALGIPLGGVIGKMITGGGDQTQPQANVYSYVQPKIQPSYPVNRDRNVEVPFNPYKFSTYKQEK